MPKPTALRDLWMSGLVEHDRAAILRDAGIDDDRPTILRGQGGSYDDADRWLQQHRTRLVALSLRYSNPSDSVIAELCRDGDIVLPERSDSVKRLIMKGFEATSGERLAGAVNLVEAAAGVASLLQVFVAVSALNSACGFQDSPPDVLLKPGSLEISLSGGLFATGVLLLVGCSAGLVGAPILGPIGGAAIATVGFIDMAIGWRKSILEQREIARRLAAPDPAPKRIYPDIEAKRSLLAHEEMLRAAADQGFLAMPPVADVPRGVVIERAEALGVSEGYANAVLNRGLPSMRLIKQHLSGVEISVLDQGRQGPGRQSEVYNDHRERRAE